MPPVADFWGILGDLVLPRPPGCTVVLGDFGNFGMVPLGDVVLPGDLVARSSFRTAGDLDLDFADRTELCVDWTGDDVERAGDSGRDLMDRIELGRDGAGDAAGEGRCRCFNLANFDADELRFKPTGREGFCNSSTKSKCRALTNLPNRDSSALSLGLTPLTGSAGFTKASKLRVLLGCRGNSSSPPTIVGRQLFWGFTVEVVRTTLSVKRIDTFSLLLPPYEYLRDQTKIGCASATARGQGNCQDCILESKFSFRDGKKLVLVVQ